MSQTQRRSSRTANRQTGTTRPPKSLGKNISTTLTTALLATALATPVLAQEKNGTLVPAPSKHSATNSVLAQGDSVHRFDIRPQALIPALIAYGEAADVQLVFDSQLARNLETPGVTGTMPDREALQRLLAGTGLHFSFTDNKTITLARTSDDSSEKVLGPITVEGQGASARGPVDGYVAARSAIASKTDTPLIETAQSISVVTRDQLDSRNVNKLHEALRFTPGVNPEPFGYEPRYTNLMMRGMDAATTGLFRDGMLMANPGFAVSYNPEPWGAERIEVPRGPASVLYGQGAAGGLVNFVSKRPTGEKIRVMELETGSFNRYQAKVDFGGNTDETGDISYRLTALARKSDTQIDFVEDDRIWIAPSVTARVSDRTKLTLLTSYQEDDTRNSQALPGVGTLTENPNGDIPTSRFTGEPDVDKYHRAELLLGYEVEHDSSDAVSVFHTLRYNILDLDDIVVFSNGLAADQRTVNRGAFASFGNLHGITTDNRVQLKFGDAAIKQTLLIGVDHQRIDVSSIQHFGAAPSIDIFNPVYGATVNIPAPFKDEDSVLTQTGLYAQDQIALGKNWKFSLAGRYDRARSETDNNLTGSTTTQRDSAFTMRAGAVYLSDSGLAPYASYAESFLPIVGNDPAGNPFEPQTSQQFEVGIKYQPKGYNSFITLAAFDLTRQNDTETDPVSFATVQTGEVRSRGIELEASASLDSGLDLTAGYTYLDTEITESVNAARIGDELSEAPHHTATLWADYTQPTGQLQGLGFGAGLRYVSSNFGFGANTVSVPGYLLADASIHYEWKALNMGIYALNLFDNEHVGSCSVRNGANFCTMGETRTVKATVGLRW